MNSMDLLKRQHRDVRGLFKKVEKSKRSTERRRLLDQIVMSLEAHTTIEEELFYPAVRELEARKAQEMVAEALEEHHVVKLVLRELPQVDVEDDQFEAKMTVLSELVEHHVKEEEKEMFKTAKRLGNERLWDLGEQMQARFEEIAGQRTRRQRRAA